MQPTVALFSEMIQLAAVLLIVLVWMVTAPRLKSPWIPCSAFSRLAVFVLVFLFAWDRFIAQTAFLSQPLYLWYGIILMIAVFAHWVKISREEPAKHSG